MPIDFQLPFIRWADTVRVAAGGQGAYQRQLYDHELVYVLEGSGHIVLDGQKHAAPPDSLFLVRPRVWHSFLSDCGQSQRLLGVHFDWSWQHDTPRFEKFFAAVPPVDTSLFREPQEIGGWDLNAQPYLDLAGRPRVRRALEDVVAEYARGDREAGRVAGALLAAAIGHIEREARLLGELSHQEIGADAVRRVQKARELLEAPHEEVLSIEEIAVRVGWSGDHLRRMVKAVLSTSPAQIQTAARVRRAKELLRYGTLSVAEIAHRCGFEDASHFSRVFRREVGSTPREWAALSRDLPK